MCSKAFCPADVVLVVWWLNVLRNIIMCGRKKIKIKQLLELRCAFSISLQKERS